MTGPGIGYPDYQAQPNSRAVLATNNVVVSALATLTLGPFNTSNFSVLRLAVSCSVDGVTVTIDFMSTTGGNTATQSQTYDVNTTGVFDVYLPIVGNTMDVKIRSFAGVNMNVAYTVELLNIPIPSITSASGALSRGVNAFVLGAGNTSTWQTLLASGGVAYLHFRVSTAGAASEIFIQSQDMLRNLVATLYDVSATSPVINDTIILPPSPCVVKIFNASGAAMTYDFSLTETGKL